jgi:hypothetical protein
MKIGETQLSNLELPSGFAFVNYLIGIEFTFPLYKALALLEIN